MSGPILYLPPKHPLHGLHEPLRSKFAAAQRNLIHLEYPTAGAICTRVFSDLRIQVAPPKNLADKPVGELVDLPFQKLSQLMLGILQRAGVPEPSLDSRQSSNSDDGSSSIVREDSGNSKTWLFFEPSSPKTVIYRQTRKPKS